MPPLLGDVSVALSVAPVVSTGALGSAGADVSAGGSLVGTGGSLVSAGGSLVGTGGSLVWTVASWSPVAESSYRAGESWWSRR